LLATVGETEFIELLTDSFRDDVYGAFVLSGWPIDPNTA
jgi:hypothetical protein